MSRKRQPPQKVSVHTEICAPGYLRGLAFFALVFTPILALIAFLAWWVDGAAVGLWTLPLWLGMAAYWLWQWQVWARRFRLDEERLTVLTPGRVPLQVLYTDLVDLQVVRSRVLLTTPTKIFHLHGDANTLAELAAALIARAPILRAARASAPRLPIVIAAPRQSVLIMGGFGLLIGLLGLGLMQAAITEVEFPDRVLAVIFAGIMVIMGGVLLYWLLWTFVWHYTFAADAIAVRHSLYMARYDPTQLRQMALQQSEVTTRGIRRTLYTLRLEFATGPALIVQPGGQNYPFDYAEVHEKLLLTQLLAQLQRAYIIPTVTRRNLDPATHWEPLAGESLQRPDFIIELYSLPADLRVTIHNHGERQPGAETIYLHLSRPVAGQQRLHTTNGGAIFSESGLYLLLHTPFLLIAIDAQTRQAWHYRLPPRTMLLTCGWEAERIVGKMVPYGKRAADAESIGPWSWTMITHQWQPGLGSVADSSVVRIA
ncbi:MAG: hypothetical protein R3C14_31255 [Caldilineaceae bacterium]